jgi:hypothetical protein
MANELMAVEIEIDPRGVASPLRTTYDLTVESSCLRNVSYLDRNVKWSQLHNGLLVYVAIDEFRLMVDVLVTCSYCH